MSEARDGGEAATRPVIDSLLGRSSGGASKPPIPSLLATSADGRPRVNWVPRRDREGRSRDRGRDTYRRDDRDDGRRRDSYDRGGGGGDAEASWPRQPNARDNNNAAPPRPAASDRAHYLDDDIMEFPTYEEWRTLLDAYADSSQQAFSRCVKEWDERRTQLFAERHWKEEWFLLRYDATAVAEVASARRAALVARAQSLAMDTPELIPVKEVERVAVIPAVPAKAPMAAVEGALKAAGASQVFFSDVDRSAMRQDMSRACIAVFADVNGAIAAGAYLAVAFAADSDGATRVKTLEGEEADTVRLPLKPFRAPDARSLHDELRTAERIAHDAERALALAKLLDAAEGVPVGVEAFLQRAAVATATSESSLDALLWYLRRVHLYDYYAGFKAADEGEFLHETRIVFERQASSTAPPAAHVTARSVDDGVDKVLQRFAPDAVARRAEEAEKARRKMADAKAEVLAALVKEVTVKEDEEKYRCTLPPRKLFKAPHFVEKHVANMHRPLLSVEERRATRALLLEQWAADTDKPLPRLSAALQKFVEPAPRPLLGAFPLLTTAAPARYGPNARVSDWHCSAVHGARTSAPAVDGVRSRRRRLQAAQARPAW